MANELVDLYWDMNTCPLTYSAQGLVERIERSLNTVHAEDGRTYSLSSTRIVCGDLRKVSNVDLDLLRRQGFLLEHCIDRDPYCNEHYRGKPNAPSPDLELETHLLDRSLKPIPGRPTTILLLSSEFHFRYSLNTFRDQGFKIFLGLKEEVRESDFKKAAHYAWIWQQMQLGGIAPFFIRPFNNSGKQVGSNNKGKGKGKGRA